MVNAQDNNEPIPSPDAPPSPLRTSWARKTKTFVFGDYDYRYLCMYVLCVVY